MVAVGHLVLSKLTLYLVALGSHTAGERSVNRLHLVYMHVQSFLSCERFVANVAEVVVNLPWQTEPLAPPALLHVVDEPQQVLSPLSHRLGSCTSALSGSTVWDTKIFNKTSLCQGPRSGFQVTATERKN